jgi:alpha-L-rhamnosidase
MEHTGLYISKLTCEFMVNPIGIDIEQPRLSWAIESQLKNVFQTSYQLRVYEYDFINIGVNDVFMSDRVYSEESVCIEISELKLKPKTQYKWKVKVWDSHGNESDWSEAATFETALFKDHVWEGKWIEPVQRPPVPDVINCIQDIFNSNHKNEVRDYSDLNPCSYLRKQFTLQDRAIKKARIYATARGIYELELNGQGVSDKLFCPGTTSYDNYLEYQTYDVTDQLNTNESNVLGVVLADGWYAGRIGGPGTNMNYGDKTGCLLELEVVYSDGQVELICSDDSFKSTNGPYVYSDIFIGERYDARLELGSWNECNFDDSAWTDVEISEDQRFGNLTAEYGEPVKSIMVLAAKTLIITPNNEFVIDFGQNITGRVEMVVKGEAGTEVILEHSEILDEEGNYLNNIMGRNKDQKDVYVLKGDGIETYEPRFTFHGFRYVRVTGYPGHINLDNFKAKVLSSDLKRSGTFTSSHEQLNQLQSNIYWSQLGNMLSIPMDCPQRERAGWTGDIQVYGPTAVFIQDVNPFLTRWLRNVKLEQSETGQVPILVPYWKAYQKVNYLLFDDFSATSAGWGDVCTVLPWTLYQAYGDKRILEENYEMMLKWVGYIEEEAKNRVPSDKEGKLTPEEQERNQYLWNTGFHFGDWMIPSFLKSKNQQEGMLNSALFTKEYTATLYFCHSCEIVSKVADLLGDTETADKYRQLCEKIRKAFAGEYLDEQGNLKANYQGIHIIALKFNMIPEQYKQSCFDNLVNLITENGYRLDTGFMSVPFILDVLCEFGREDIAFKLLYQNECPSWMYQIEHDATTMWESWSAIKPDGQRTNVSYNHYAFGCVGSWMYSYIAGISSLEPGYKKILINPHSGDELNEVNCSYESVYGLINSHWEIKDETMYLNVTIPANTSASVILPHNNLNEILLDGKSIHDIEEGVSLSNYMNKQTLELGSGKYKLEIKM